MTNDTNELQAKLDSRSARLQLHVNNAIKMLGTISPVLAGLAVAIVSTGSIQEQFVNLLHFNGVFAWFVAGIVAIVIEVLGILFITLKSHVELWNQEKNKSDNEISTTLVNAILYGYVGILVTLIVTTKAFPQLAVGTLLVLVMMAGLTYIYHAENDKLERAKLQKNAAKMERGKLAEYRQTIAELKLENESLQSQLDSAKEDFAKQIAELQSKVAKSNSAKSLQSAEPDFFAGTLQNTPVANDNSAKLSKKERHVALQSLLKSKYADVAIADLNNSEIAKMLNVNSSTIGRDLQELQSANKL